MTTLEELKVIEDKIAQIKEENFGVCPSGKCMDELLDKMWGLQAKLREENKK